MNLTKLFETQRKLDERIVKGKGLEGQDLLPMKILALQVELGELANEWRGFKFWSENREPRTLIRRLCHSCDGKGKFNISANPNWIPEPCLYCEGTGFEENRNPLLEEYVDCLHFILSIGNALGMSEDVINNFRFITKENLEFERIVRRFNDTFHYVSQIGLEQENYYDAAMEFLDLGEMLGFTWEQIDQAYYTKNQTNHERQTNGY